MPTVPKPRIPEPPKYPKCHLAYHGIWVLVKPDGSILFKSQYKPEVMTWAKQRGVDFYYS